MNHFTRKKAKKSRAESLPCVLDNPVYAPIRYRIAKKESFMEDQLSIIYDFRLSDGSAKRFTLSLDAQTLGIRAERPSAPPFWADLEHHKCSLCPLESTNDRYCPAAVHLAAILGEFRELFAHDKAFVTVITDERTYSRDTTIQQGLSALIGIVMTTSGCPVLDHLRPLVRFHLPFANLSDTVFRMASLYFFAQYFMKQEGKAVDWDLNGIQGIYEQIGQVNRDFAERIADTAKKDANLNALVNLDCFASMVPLALEDTLEELKSSFFAYLK
ncbi:MAG: hypothetical protein Q8K68_09095 [Nitrospirota bacterium]|nr:hypothetical protein [Nitrospirota bacterium]